MGVYVHVPFCDRICPYCDFAVVAARPLSHSQEQRYLSGLLAELEVRRGDFAGRALSSLYLGGGTPSLFHPESVARLVERVKDHFVEGDAPAEVTLEVNPSTVERSRLPGFRQAGVNRLSIGVQSFDDQVLRRLGRAHRADEARATLDAAREARFDNLSVDILFAGPGASLGQLEHDLQEVAKVSPEHVSAYELSVEPGTPFETAHRRGQLALPSEGESVGMMETVESRLAACGLARYEISSYSRPGCESRHNRRYWERLPVLGLGMGAWSTDPSSSRAPHGVRRANVRRLEPYLSAVEGGLSPEAENEELSASTARGEAIFLGLRCLRGFEAEPFEAEFGAPPRSFFGPVIDDLVSGELVEESLGGNLRLTPRGLLLSDSVFESFV